ncbi:IucA/IucC family protein [Yinghuangia soli]|uniref:IucA/IucC family siderophore biosynthesis protein n=1 Tax=Yinghuangia soli TaxID=2908204 RepID=A0AA41U8M6_9ACTN|nr:IucA/IucC family siderophore biosynthesis protein [Yinghuangia soli]MCF2533054.1 IucA/IucC family siderophore biosynthesis protein [Yinghuangia soli]
MLAKALAEFAYEELLAPVHEHGDTYRIDLPGEVRYRFRARRGAYDCWHVDPASLRRGSPLGDEPGDDMLRFLLDAHTALGLTGDTAGHLVRELTATLAADVALSATAQPASVLADLDYADLEGHQTGHPWIVANKGRLGFSATDAAAYAPESRRTMRLPWIAVHRDLAQFRGVPGLDEHRLYAEELDPATAQRFRERMHSRLGEDADLGAYLWLPVHPWQWDETIAPLFAPDIAAGRILRLGEAPDRYLAQQSVRTFLDVDQPGRRTVKLPLSVLNTLVWRGLPTERTLAAPAVTAWVHGLRDSDPFLRDECRVVLLGETASVTVRHPVLEDLPGVPYQYRELLGTIWREPLVPELGEGERARTLASLLHVDPYGRPFVAELVDRSGIAPRAWLRSLFHTMLPPLLHCLYQYGLVFSPHGENAIVVFDEYDVPTRLAVKDFVDDVNITDQPLPELADLPADVSAVLLREAPAYLCQFIHAALLVGHYRYLADLAEMHLGVPQSDFWAMVRDEILDHQARFPELSERHRMFDLLTPRIDRLCLNRNRLLLDGYRDRPGRPHVAAHGTVPNPLYGGPR